MGVAHPETVNKQMVAAARDVVRIVRIIFPPLLLRGMSKHFRSILDRPSP